MGGFMPSNWGFPSFLNGEDLAIGLQNRAEKIATTVFLKDIKAQLFIITGSGGVQKDLFAAYLTLQLYRRSTGKTRPRYIYTPAIETVRPIVGYEEDDTTGHFTVFGAADQIDKRYSRAVLARIFSILSNGNVVILSVKSMDSLYAKYGQDFVQTYEKITRVIELSTVNEIVLEAI